MTECPTECPEHGTKSAASTAADTNSPLAVIAWIVAGAVSVLIFWWIKWVVYPDSLFKGVVKPFIFGNGYPTVLVFAFAVVVLAVSPRVFRFIAWFLTGTFVGTIPFLLIISFLFVFLSFIPPMGPGAPSGVDMTERRIDLIQHLAMFALFFIGIGMLLLVSCFAPGWVKRHLLPRRSELIAPGGSLLKWIIAIISLVVIPPSVSMIYYGYFGEFLTGPKYFICYLLAAAIGYRFVKN